MSRAFIFVATNKVREGKLEAEKRRVPGWVQFIHDNEPRTIGFHEYRSEDGTEVEYVQIHHHDTDSFEHLSFAKTSAGSQVVDLSVMTRALSELDDHVHAPPASAPPLPCWRPPPPRPREPGLAPATRRLQANHGPAPTTPD